MHIIFTTREKARLKKLPLPKGTTLAQTNPKGRVTKSWLIGDDSKWTMTCDWVDLDRPFKPGEAKAFHKSLTPERVLDFFICHDDHCPQREYREYISAEYKYFKYIRHSGTYQPDNEYGERRNIFQITLSTNADINAAEVEIKNTLTKLAKAYPKWNPICIDLMEETLSAGGIYAIDWNRRKTFVLHKTTRGRREVVCKFTSLLKLLEYVKKHHPYK